jgi:hypothetical protein
MVANVDGTLCVSTRGTVVSCFDKKVHRVKSGLGNMAPSTLHAMAGRTPVSQVRSEHTDTSRRLLEPLGPKPVCDCVQLVCATVAVRGQVVLLCSGL